MIAFFLAVAALLQSASAEPAELAVSIQKHPAECSEFYPIRKGKTIPAAVVDGAGVALCSGVLSPLSEFARFQAIESAAAAADKLSAMDIAILEAERDWYKQQLETARDVKWYQKPAAHRWAGRLDVVIVAIALTGTAAAVYNIGNR